MFQKWVDVHHRPMGFETGTPENARVFSKTNQKIKKKNNTWPHDKCESFLKWRDCMHVEYCKVQSCVHNMLT